jgi:S1-C subfamily serine protease
MRTAALALLLLPALPAAARDDGGSKVYKRVVRSVVWVHSPRDRGLATGSGTLIDLDRRLVLTNYHVVEDQAKARVFFPAFRSGQIVSEKKYYTDRIKQFAIPGRVVARDRQADLALIQIDSVPDGVQAVPLAAASPEPGQSVHSIGNAGASDALWGYVPGKVRQVYRKKWKARLDRSRVLEFEAKVVETDSPTNPGDSGGPLVNDKGELVGVTQGGATDANLVSTFVDISEVRRLLNSDDAKRVRGDRPKPEPAVPKRDKALPIKDEAKLFADEAEKKAQATIDELFAKHKLDVLVETYPAIRDADKEKVKAMPAKERTEYMRTWARSRVAAEHVTGFVILISNDPKSLYVDLSADAVDKFPKEFHLKVRDALVKKLKDKPDEALADVVAMIAENRGKK